MNARTIVNIPLASVYGNPDQPRQTFEPEALRELADSIASQGLIQPITVTPRGDRYMIVAGERRFRAHQLLGRVVIAAMVETLDDRNVMLQAIIENAMRRDVNIIEEATAYQRCVDMGMSPEEIAAQIGVATLRECNTTLLLRARGAAILEASRQLDAFADLEAPTESVKRLALGFEARVRRVVATLRDSTVDNEIVAVKRVDPTRAGTLADLFAAMQGDLKRIEAALREAASQAPLI